MNTYKKFMRNKTASFWKKTLGWRRFFVLEWWSFLLGKTPRKTTVKVRCRHNIPMLSLVYVDDDGFATKFPEDGAYLIGRAANDSTSSFVEVRLYPNEPHNTLR